MVTSSKKEIKIPEKLFELFFSTIKRIGLKDTEQLLIQSNNYEDVGIIKLEIIKNAVCKYFDISKKELILGKKRFNRPDAKSVLAFILKNKMDYKPGFICYHINTNYDTYRWYLRRIEELNPKLKCDKDILDKIEKINNDIDIQFKNL